MTLFSTWMGPKFQPTKSSLPAEVHIGLEDCRLRRKTLYTGQFQVSAESTEKWALDVIELAIKFQLSSLQDQLIKQLHVTHGSLWKLYLLAEEHNLMELRNKCLTYILTFSEDMLTSPEFLMLPVDQVVNLMKKDTFYAREIDILKVCHNYILTNEGANTKQVLSVVRMSNIPHNERDEAANLLINLLGNNATHILINNPYNPCLMPRICTRRLTPYQPRLIGLELVNTENSRNNRKIPINTVGSIEVDVNLYQLYEECVLNFRLDMVCRLDQIQFNLMIDKDTQDKITVGYSGLFRYVIHGSQDGLNWHRLAEMKNDLYQGLQNIYFEKQDIQFLKIHGGGRSWMELVLNMAEPGLPSLKCSYRDVSINTENGILVTNYNAAHEEEGATVYVNGVQNLRTKLLTSASDDEKQDVPCNFRFILNAPDNFIEIVLAQQYNLNVIKFTLLDPEKSSFDYVVYVTPDHRVIPYNMRGWKATMNTKFHIGWKEIQRGKKESGLQTIRFQLQTVAAIRIECINVRNDASKKDFGLIHFECFAA